MSGKIKYKQEIWRQVNVVLDTAVATAQFPRHLPQGGVQETDPKEERWCEKRCPYVANYIYKHPHKHPQHRCRDTPRMGRGGKGGKDWYCRESIAVCGVSSRY